MRVRVSAHARDGVLTEPQCESYPHCPVMAANLSGGTVDESTSPALRNLARVAAGNLLGKD